MVDSFFDHIDSNYVFYHNYARSQKISRSLITNLNVKTFLFTQTYGQYFPRPNKTVSDVIIRDSFFSSNFMKWTNFYTKSCSFFLIQTVIFENVARVGDSNELFSIDCYENLGMKNVSFFFVQKSKLITASGSKVSSIPHNCFIENLLVLQSQY